MERDSAEKWIDPYLDEFRDDMSRKCKTTDDMVPTTEVAAVSRIVLTVPTLPLTKLPVGLVSADVLVCGDPSRATRIAERLENVKILSENREYRALQGFYKGTSITVCSHGIGAPGASIAFEELIRAGAKRIIRVGTCGSLQNHVLTGDVIIATSSVDYTGYAREVVPPGFPAVADMDLTMKLRSSAIKNGVEAHCGLILTRDSFYRGVNRSIQAAPDYLLLSQARVLCVEMESSTLFIVGTLRQVQTASILAVDGNVLSAPENMDSYKPHEVVVYNATEKCIKIALDAIAGSDA